MKIIIIYINLVLSLLFLFPNCNRKDTLPVLKGPYLGQKTPGLTPSIFAPDIFSQSKPEWAFSTAFTPDGDEFYFTKYNPVKKTDQIMHMKMVNDIWTKPEVCLFNNEYSANDVRISPDGSRLLFRSNRPTGKRGNPERHFYLWFVNKNNNGWSEPRPIECGGKFLRTGDLGIADNGNLYFAYRIGNISGIYRSIYHNSKYRTPEFVCSMNDSLPCEGDTFVSPDESYIIVTCWDLPENKGESDLYISFQRDDGSWTALKNMGEPINTKNNENCATLSHDGKFLFYMSVLADGDVPKCTTYWVDSKIIDGFKKETGLPI